MPALLAAELDALLYECALYLEVSIPEEDKTDVNHLAIVLDVTELNVLNETKSFVDFLKVFVLCIYSFKNKTGQSDLSL